jgi:hypothetical protein
MKQQTQLLNDQQIDSAIEQDLLGEFLKPESKPGPPTVANASAQTNTGESITRAVAPTSEDPVFLGPDATRMKRNSAEHQLQNHIAQLGWFDKFVVNAGMRGAHRKAALQLTDALVRVSVETAKLKLSMSSQIIRAELLIEFLRIQPRLAAEVSRLCHETRTALSEQLFQLSDEIYHLRNSRMARIAENEKKGIFSKEDADQQREILKQIVADELIDKWGRYGMVFRNISRHFVRTLTTALEHVQNAASISTTA